MALSTFITVFAGLCLSSQMLALECFADDSEQAAHEIRMEAIWRAKTLERTDGVWLQYYTVEGSTKEEVLRSIQGSKLQKINGKKIAALTTWKVEWEWEFDDGKPLFDTIDVRVAITVTMPKWVPPLGAPEVAIGRWRRFREALEKHEGEHVKIAKRVKERIEHRVKALHAKNPHLSIEEVEETANKIVRYLQYENNIFDKRTRFGRTQGVAF